MTHSEARHIEGGAPRGPSSIQPLASSFQNSTREELGSRNRRNPPDKNDIHFSTREEIRGGLGLARRGGRNPWLLQHPAPSIQRPESNRNKPGSRNARNSLFVSDLIFSTRNKIGGVASQKSALSASRTLLRDEDFTNVCAEKPSRRLALGTKCSAAALSAASYNFESVSRPTHVGGSSNIGPLTSNLHFSGPRNAS